MRLRARIRRPHRGVRPEQRAACVGRLDEELVVADQRDDLGVQIERVLAKHLAVGEGTEAVELVGEVVDEGAVGGHGRIRALAAAGVKRIRTGPRRATPMRPLALTPEQFLVFSPSLRCAASYAGLSSFSARQKSGCLTLRPS